MVAERLGLDQRTLDRLGALAMLQQETLPGVPYSVDDALQQALGRGLDLMLSELLLHRGHPRIMNQRKPESGIDA